MPINRRRFLGLSVGSLVLGACKPGQAPAKTSGPIVPGDGAAPHPPEAALGTRPQTPSAPTPQPPTASASTGTSGFYRIDAASGVVWLVNPAGERALSLGINHVEPKLMLMPYNRQQTFTRYGQDFANGMEFNPAGRGARKFVDAVLANLKSWGFNTLGYHTTVPSSLFHTAVAYCPRRAPHQPVAP